MKTLLVIALSVLAWTVSAADHGIIAGPSTNLANGHFYYLLKSATWSNSEACAVSYGGHLATVRDADENQWIVDTFARYGGMERPLWIGLSDRRVEGVFEWSSGEPFAFSHWNVASGEPNNSGGSGYEEDFVYIIQEHSGNPTVLAGFWNDLPDDGYGVIPPVFGVLESDHLIDPAPPVVTPPVAHLRLGCVEVCWQSMGNVQYQVEWKASYGTNAWDSVGPPVTGTGAEMCVPDVLTRSNRVYRVSVLP